MELLCGGDKVAHWAGRSADSVAGDSKVEERRLGGFECQHVVEQRADFVGAGVMFDTDLEAGAGLCHEGVAKSCSVGFDIYKPRGESPLIIFVSRTEKPTLTGSSGSRGDSGWGILVLVLDFGRC